MHKVIYAKLQTEAYIPGAGALGTTFPPNTKTLENLTMTADDTTLAVSFTYRGLKKKLLIPFGNVILMEVAPGTESTSIKAPVLESTSDDWKHIA